MLNEIYWEKALMRTNSSRNNNSLFPLKTKDITSKIYKGKDFIIRELDISKFRKNLEIGPKKNPFSPWEENLEIASVGENHHLILNKYPVQLGHMLLITNGWKSQSNWLDKEDWEAIKKVNNDTTGLWFFNSGPLAGASQPHRHIQLLRRGQNEINFPREEWFLDFTNKRILNQKFYKNISIKKFFTSLNNENLYKCYLELSKKIGLGNPQNDVKPKKPYNLLLTNKCMIIIKRKKDNLKGISINALGFAGYILVTVNSDVMYLSKYGPQKLLENYI